MRRRARELPSGSRLRDSTGEADWRTASPPRSTRFGNAATTSPKAARPKPSSRQGATRRAGPPAGEASCFVGGLCSLQGDFDASDDFSRAALEVYRRVGDQRGVITIFSALGLNERMRGELCLFPRVVRAVPGDVPADPGRTGHGRRPDEPRVRGEQARGARLGAQTARRSARGIPGEREPQQRRVGVEQLGRRRPRPEGAHRSAAAVPGGARELPPGRGSDGARRARVPTWASSRAALRILPRHARGWRSRWRFSRPCGIGAAS